MLFAQQPAELIGALVCLGVIFLPVLCLVGSIVLRAAVSWYNRFAGTTTNPSPVPMPTLGRGMGIILVTTVAHIAAVFVSRLIVGIDLLPRRDDQQAVGWLTQLVSLPVSVLVLAGMLKVTLPTTFSRAILVALLHVLIIFLITGAIIAFLVAGVLAWLTASRL